MQSQRMDRARQQVGEDGVNGAMAREQALAAKLCADHLEAEV